MSDITFEADIFEAGTCGGDFHPNFQPSVNDLVVQERWCSSEFANTDLDLLLKQQGIHKLIIIGLRANTCIDSTIRFAAEPGYETTLELNAPNYASAILSTSIISILSTYNPETRTLQAKI